METIQEKKIKIVLDDPWSIADLLKTTKGRAKLAASMNNTLMKQLHNKSFSRQVFGIDPVPPKDPK